MLSKLALKNASRNFKDYAVYFFTLVLGVCVFYMFNSIYAQKEIMDVTKVVNESFEVLQKILSYFSVFVAVVLGFLIVYANNFFVRRRKKELGIYMTLGMSKGNICLILVLETFIMALGALIVGISIGVFASQLMSVFTAKMFEADMTSYTFIFSLEAVIKSVIYFSIMFLTVMIFNTLAIGKFKLIDLLYGGRKNETEKLKSTKVAVCVFILSLVCLVSAYVIILINGMIYVNFFFISSIILGVIGTVLFFLSVSKILIHAMRNNKKLYYKNLNMFVVRQFSSKINTNFASISVVCLVLFLVICTFSSGYSIQSTISNELRTTVPNDLSVIDFYDTTEIRSIVERLPSEIKNSDLIKNSYEYAIANLKEGKVNYDDYDIQFPESLRSYGRFPIRFMSISDYNEIRKMQGKDEVALPVMNYIVVYDKENTMQIAKQFIDKNIPITVGETTLHPITNAEKFIISNSDYGEITFVVDDSQMKFMNVKESVWAVNCVDENASLKFATLLDNYHKETGQDTAFVYYISKQLRYQSTITTKAIISFLTIYLGIVFMISCAAILAIQQLSEAADNRERYELLRKLGVEYAALNKALFIQILCYFVLPLSLATVHSAIGLTVANEALIKLGSMNLLSNIFITAMFIIIIYGIYFILTYTGSKNIINKE